MLAAKLMLEQNIQVEGINFFTGFCVEGHTHAIRKKDQAKPKRNNALWSAEQLGIKLHILDISQPYKTVVLNPKHGYGANLNPCLDCKSFMVREAYHWMQAHQFDFIITGEVLGQRPMSQRRQTFPVIEQESGAGGLLLRPLCAKLLAPTIPEQENWVDREQLLAFNGRSRKPQIELAQRFGFADYAQPAGGCCFLTDISYSRKLGDLWQARKVKDYELEDIILLKIGRHLRPKPAFKLIIGREEGENRFLSAYRHHYTHFEVISHLGPFSLLDGQIDNAEDWQLAAQIIARFSQGHAASQVEIQMTHPDGQRQLLTVNPLPADQINAEWYL